MADADEEDWLYGNEEKDDNKGDAVNDASKPSGDDNGTHQEQPSQDQTKTSEDNRETPTTNGLADASEMVTNGNEQAEEEQKTGSEAPAPESVIKIDDDSDSDDDVQVTIGAITAGPAGSNEPGGALVGQGSANRSYYRNPVQVVGTQKTSVGKGIDLAAPGNINGQAVIEVNLDSLEDKPWRKPGADISDYFNYGFNEVTWKFYCDKQKRLREGDTSALTALPLLSTPSAQDRIAAPITNILSKFEKSKHILTSPAANRFDNTVRTISTLQVTRRKEDMLNQLKMNQPAPGVNTTPPTSSAANSSIPAVAAPTSTALFTVPPPTVNGPPPPIFDPTKPPPAILGLPIPGFPPPGGILPIRPPGTDFIQIPPVSGAAFMRPPGTYIVPPSGQQPFFNPDEDDAMHRNRSDSQHRQSDGYPSDEEGRYRPRRDYERDRERYQRRSEYRDDYRDRNRDYDRERDRGRDRDRERDRERDRDRDRDRERDRDRDRDRESRRRREDSPSRHKSSRRKHEDDDRHASKHKKSKKYKHDKEKGEPGQEEDGAPPEEQKA